MRALKHPAFVFLFLIAVVAIVALLLNDNGAIRRARVQPAVVAHTMPTTPRTLSPLPSRPISGELKRLRAKTMQTVAQTRSLDWTTEVGMVSLSGWEYGARTREVAEIFGGDDLRALGRLAAAGGVLPAGIDLASLAASFTAVSASASYSPFDKKILLVDKERRSESLITHEMTHALQDQHFDLARLLVRRPYEFDRTEAAFAVVEGDAVSVQRRFEQGANWERVSPERIAQIEDRRFDEYREQIGFLFPPLLFETFIFRYRDGVRFVETVRRKNGQAAINQLLQNPPVSSEQVLHPEKYFANELPREVGINTDALAALGWRDVVSSPLGEIGVRGVLLAGTNATEANRAASGWNGDRAYLFESRDTEKDETPHTLFVWSSAWDTEKDANEFFAAYGKLLNARGAEKIETTATNETGWRENNVATLIRQRGTQIEIVRAVEDEARQAIANL